MAKNKNKNVPEFSNKIKKIFSNKKVRLSLLAGFVVIIVILIVLLVFQFIDIGSDADQSQDNEQTTGQDDSSLPEVKIVDDKYERKIDGRLVDSESQANPWIIGVMIENLVTVRPQAGLSAAPLVYETLAEGGISRFVVFFNGDENLAKIGPVRSARPYYIEWVSEFDAVYSYCGGSPTALAAISGLEIKDINQIGGFPQYYWRDASLSAPHNLFTSSELLSRALRDQGLDQEEPEYRSWKYKTQASLSDRPDGSKTIHIDFSSGASYDTEFKYDRENNDYVRYQLGTTHKDSNNGSDIRAKNVAVIRVPAEDYEPEKGRLILDVAGTGQAYIFIDGEKIEGTWEKENRTARTLFYDQDEKEVEFNRGNTWVVVVPGDRAISYLEE